MIIKHLGIIPDGNRRWAREKGLSYGDAYICFSNHICDIIRHLTSYPLDMVTFYVISKENLGREQSDLADVMDAVKVMLGSKILPLANELDVQIRCIGLDNVADADLVSIARNVQSLTRQNSGMIVNFLIGYNPFDEINSVIQQYGTLSIEKLSIPLPVDLLIRTAGCPTRLSNFLPLQCGYALIETVEPKFLDLNCSAIDDIFAKYSSHTPNYGK